jgi:iron complex outermembrane receptor protein
MKKPLRLIITVLVSTLSHLNIKAQETDTVKHIFQLGQVNIIGTKDSLRSDKLSAGTINRYKRLTDSTFINNPDFADPRLLTAKNKNR